jgi:hypothetical protein
VLFRSVPKSEKQIAAAAARKAKAAEIRRIKNEARQEEWNKKVEASKELILGSFEDDKRKKSFVKGLETLQGSLFENFRFQWNTYGKLTEKQIQIVVSSFERKFEVDTIYRFFKKFVPGQEYEIRVTLEKFEPEHVTTYPNGDQAVHSWFVFKTVERQTFSLKTNNKKLIERLTTQFELTPTTKLKVKVKYVSSDNSNIIIDPRPVPKIV